MASRILKPEVQERLRNLTHEIISGRKNLSYNNQRYTLTNPSLDIILEADLIYAQYYNDHLYDDQFLSPDNIPLELIKCGLFFPGNEEDIKNYNKELDSAKKNLFKNYKNEKQKQKHKAKIKTIKENLNKLYNFKHYLDFLTLEKHCENLRHEYIIAHTLYNYSTNTLLFNYSTFKDTDASFFNSIMDVITNNIIDLSTLKKIVTSEYWKNIYTHNKNNVFKHCATEYTEEQKNLINLSAMYDSIYQHPECPDDNIIEDEDALDGWMLVQKDKIKRQKTQSGVLSKMSSKVASQDHVMIPTSQEEAQDIIALSEQETGGLNGIKRLGINL